MKATAILSLIFIISLPKASLSGDNFISGARYTYIKCRSDNSSLALRYCHLKAYSRRLVTANIGLTLLKPLGAPVVIEIVYSYRYGNIFREVIRSPKIEWCGIMSGIASNPIVSSIIHEIKDSAAAIFKKCPYDGEIDLVNITTAHEKAASEFWEGFYKFELYVWKKDKELFYMDLRTHVKSKYKDSFG